MSQSLLIAVATHIVCSYLFITTAKPMTQPNKFCFDLIVEIED